MKICKNCGKVNSDEAIRCESCEEFLDKTTDDKKERKSRIDGGILFIIIVIVICFIAIGYGVYNHYEIKRAEEQKEKISIIIADSNIFPGVDEEDIYIIENIEGRFEEERFVLIDLSGDYKRNYIVGVDLYTKEVDVIQCSYDPLSAVLVYILTNEGDDTQIELLNKLSGGLKKHGFDSFKNEERAKDQLRELTGKDGILSVANAQSIIEEKMVAEDTDDITVVYEDNSAVPVGYIVEEWGYYKNSSNSYINYEAYDYNGDYISNHYSPDAAKEAVRSNSN